LAIALFFYPGHDFLLYAGKQAHNRRVESGIGSVILSSVTNIFINFHKAFNVLPDTVVLYLGEHKGSVAPN
jgi:hypothetical protein